MSVSGLGKTLSLMVFVQVLHIGIATLVRITQNRLCSLRNTESMRFQNSESLMLVRVHIKGAKCVKIEVCSQLDKQMQILRAQ